MSAVTGPWKKRLRKVTGRLSFDRNTDEPRRIRDAVRSVVHLKIMSVSGDLDLDTVSWTFDSCPFGEVGAIDPLRAASAEGDER